MICVEDESAVENSQEQNAAARIDEQDAKPEETVDAADENKQYVNSQGVRFMSDDPNLRGKNWNRDQR